MYSSEDEFGVPGDEFIYNEFFGSSSSGNDDNSCGVMIMKMSILGEMEKAEKHALNFRDSSNENG